jgi:cytidine deaminase
MVAGGDALVQAVFVAAERERFTPCGACMDWIFEFAADGCVVLFQSSPDSPVTSHGIHALMPFYPK